MMLKKILLCWLMGAHDWTCAAVEGTPPTPKQLADGVAGFWDYARTYCRRCGKESHLSVEARERAIREANHG